MATPPPAYPPPRSTAATTATTAPTAPTLAVRATRIRGRFHTTGELVLRHAHAVPSDRRTVRGRSGQRLEARPAISCGDSRLRTEPRFTSCLPASVQRPIDRASSGTRTPWRRMPRECRPHAASPAKPCARPPRDESGPIASEPIRALSDRLFGNGRAALRRSERRCRLTSQTTSIRDTARIRTGDIGRADVHQSEAGAAGALCSTSGRDDGAGS